ncbi:MAG: glycoside hydrolase family 32 protein [Opitutaceae bacterium]
MPDSAPLWPDYPAIDDPARPVWHFGPPAQWMNDPNGTLWHAGWYHVFYQHNPGGEEWGDLHWGHARSRDLVHWEHLPIALFPHRGQGELHCYSGCATLDAHGTPRILYTSVFADEKHPGFQLTASPRDADLIRWEQDVAKPVLDLASHGGPAFERGWRDPYIFRAEGRTFLVLGAWLGEESVIGLYENRDGLLREWVYRGIVHRAPKTSVTFFECPNLFQLGKKWVLLTSPVREVEWATGTLNLETYTFHVEQQGRVDEGDAFYATQTIVDPSGRTVLFGWVQRFPKGRGWNGRLNAPRHIWLDDAGWLCAEPVAELAALRTAEISYFATTLGATIVSLDLPGDHSHEVDLTVERVPTARIQLKIAGIDVVIGPDGVSFNAGRLVPLAPSATTRVRWLLDRSLIELFVGDRAVFTRVVAFPPSPIAQLTAAGGAAQLLSARAWSLRAAPPTMGF